MTDTKRVFVFLFLSILFSSCLTYKGILNFQDGKDLANNKLDTITNLQSIKIKTDDIIQVTIFSYNTEEAQRFNTLTAQMIAQMSLQGGSNSTLADPFGYRVDSKGFIEMPVIGQVKVVGKTIEEIRDLVFEKVNETSYLKSFSVQVRFLSFRVTVLGEVAAPGSYNISSQKITILDVLGLARDVTLFSNRDNILVIREKGGQRQYGRVNLKSKEIFKSPYYYLQPNDIVYVEPHKAKILAAPDPASRYLSIILGFASLAALLLRR